MESFQRLPDSFQFLILSGKISIEATSPLMSVVSRVTCGLDLPAQDVKTGQTDVVFLTLIADERLITKKGPSGQDMCTSETKVLKARGHEVEKENNADIQKNGDEMM